MLSPLSVATVLVLLIAGSCTSPPRSRAITANDVRRHVTVLADDSMRGRAAPSRELDSAAGYVAGELERAGLSPLGAAHITTFRHELRQLESGGIELAINGRPVPLRYGRDFSALYGSARVGEGKLLVLTAAELHAAESTQVRGRVLLVLMSKGSHGGDRGAALRLARGGGAAALILGHDEDIAPELESRRSRYESALRFNDTGDLVPTIYAGAELTRMLVASANADVRVDVPWRVLDPGVVPNVAGVIEGADAGLWHERVLLLAHLDHLGVRATNGRQSDSIFNGADDNASGVAALLEVAHALSAARGDLRRSVVFLFTGGEESGQLGAERFAAAAGFEPDSVVAVVNLDMVGRNGDEIRLLGGDLSSLGELSLFVLDSVGVGLRGTVESDADLFRRSDHFTFAEAGIPALWLFSGFHDDYHEPSDELERIDMDKVARVAEFVRALTLRLASADARPELTAAGRALRAN